MNRLFQIAIIIALAYITAFYTSNKDSNRELLDIDFDFDISEFFEDDYGYEYGEDADVNSVIADGRYYLNDKEYHYALEYFEQASIIDSLNSEAIYCIAECYTGLKDYYKAEEYFRKVLTMDSLYISDAYTGLGKIAFEGSKFDSSLVYFSKAIETKSDNYSAYYQRADCYLNLKDTTAAIKDFEYAIELNPYSAVYLYRVAKFYFKGRAYQKAEELYTKCMALNNTDYTYSCLFEGGLCHYYLKNYEFAINNFNRALKIKNTDAYLYYNIAISHDNLADSTKAIENYELFTISTQEYDSFYDYSMKRIKELKGEIVTD